MPDRALFDQLDEMVEVILTGAAPAATGDSELAALVQLAGELRHLPDESFKARLKTELQRRASMITSAVAPVREGFRTVTPYIAAVEGAGLIEFLKQTFGAEELVRHSGPAGGFHAEVRIGDSVLMIGGGEAARGHERPGAFHVYVPDTDATYQRAMAAGGISMGEPADRPYGERSGFVKDACGNFWYIATRLPGIEAVSPESFGTVIPYLHPASAAQFIDFAKRAFGAQELARYEDGGRVVHAAVRLGDAVLEMGEPQDPSQFLPSGFYLYVDDPDAVYERALAAGATSLFPPSDQPYGDRTAGLKDPFGFQWFPAKHIR